MSDWNSSLYLKFEKQRTQPSTDLVNRISVTEPKEIIDLGCGPGNSTFELKKRFPNARILGVDSSPEMIEKAKKAYPELMFELFDLNDDISDYKGRFDVVFSNACLQWLSNHETLIPRLMEMLKDGGELAVQMPENKDERLFVIVDAVASEKYGLRNDIAEGNRILSQREYFDILSGCSSSFDIWETVYCHPMNDCEAMLDWIRSTRLRPYLNELDDNKKAQFEADILEIAKRDYKPQKNGQIIFNFKRLFFIASK